MRRGPGERGLPGPPAGVVRSAVSAGETSQSPGQDGIPTHLVRANQWTVVASVLLALLDRPLWLMVPWTAALAGLVGGPGRQPVFLMARSLLGRRRLAGAPREDAGAQRFNALLAWILLTVALAGFLRGWQSVGWGAAAAVGLAALLATLGFCVGCAVYARIPVPVRRRLLSVASASRSR